MRRRVAQFLSAWLLLAIPVAAQESNSSWYARPWQSNDGLPDNSVEGIAQTADGYLWIGTPQGLARFDGLRFEESPLDSIISYPNRGVLAIIHAREGGLWLGMDRGAVVFLNGASSRAFVKELPDSIPNGLAEDADGNLWVAYRGGALSRINPKTGVVTQVFARGDLCSLATDTRGRIWCTKDGGAGIFENGAFQPIHVFDPKPLRIAAARDGGVWVCCGSELFKGDDSGKFVSHGDFHPGASDTVAMLAEDHEGAVWIGTPYSGLFRYGPSGFENLPTTHKGILSLAEDREGNIWVGTFGSGLNRIQRSAITLEGIEAGLPFASVSSICETPDGTIWAITQDGKLARRTNGSWTPLPATDQTGDLVCVASDAQGTLWIGSRHGIRCWRDGQFVEWNAPRELKSNTFHCVLAAKNGDLWVARESPDSIFCLHSNELKTFRLPSGSRIIRAMTEDAAGNIWAGTSKGILVRIANGQLSEVSPRRPKELTPIRCLYATPDGALWIGYAGSGLGCLIGDHYGEISSTQGLYDDFVSEIVADTGGWLWFGANRGIFKAREESLLNVAQGNSAHVRSVHYAASQGLPSLEGVFGGSPGILRSRDGRLWIPMQTALAVVDPSKLDESPEIPPTLLTRISVDDHVVARYEGILAKDPDPRVVDLASPDATLHLPPNHRRIDFEFAALGFKAPENIQCRYRLKGFDNDWADTGARRSGSFSQLPRGTYTLEVNACNTAGEWNSTSAQLSIIVAPFIWQTLWFQVTALAMFTLCVALIVRYISFRRLQVRLRALEQQAALQRERTRIAKDIHDDLGANLTQIAFLGELAQQDRANPDKVTDRITKISGTAREAVKSLDEIVWAVNPRNDTLAHLLDYAGQFTLDYLRLADIRCRLDFPEQIPQRELSTDLRHNLFLVVKEAVHNIVKHAAATEVWLRVTTTDTALEITIEDNGRGFEPPPDNPLSDGLRNMRQRMEAIGGTFQMDSHPGHGSKLHLRLPWPET